MTDSAIPPKNRPEWSQIIKGNVSHKFSNYLFQVHVHQAQKNVAAGIITEQMALEDLYKLSQKYVNTIQNDFKQIFKSW